MYKIDRANNRINQLQKRRFSDLGLQERQHLQEWLSQQPDVLGEDLLIIQKEFDGFNDTRERLDLLALDKNGQLVLIENKLDDSGRDVVWQSLKYAAYCSTLSREQIVDIFQRYLDRHYTETTERADEIISAFLGHEAAENLILNEGNSQRIILVAASFRKEVTATVMWLLGHGLSVKCVKVTPYSLGDDLILDAKQFIPISETEDFMIRMAEKDRTEADLKSTQRRSHQLRMEFWKLTLDALREAGVTSFSNVSPSRDNWVMCAAGAGSGSHYSLVFTQSDVRIQLNLIHSDHQTNKRIFDTLFESRDQIESAFGDKFEWRRMDDNITSRVVYARPFDGFNKNVWPEMVRWIVANYPRFSKAIQSKLQTAVVENSA